jgi:hypothetical protein
MPENTTVDKRKYGTFTYLVTTVLTIIAGVSSILVFIDLDTKFIFGVIFGMLGGSLFAYWTLFSSLKKP